MPKHDVMFSIPERQLGNADVEFAVRRDGKAFGRLRVSKGSVVWAKRDDTYGYKLDWIKFDELLTAKGKKENA